MRNEEILAKVKARNRLNAEIFNIVPAVFTALAPFVGEKIILATGGFSRKVKDALPVLPNAVSLSAYYNAAHGYSLKVNIKTSEMVNDNSCTYSEAVIYIGDLNNGTLAKLYEQPKPEDYPTTYTSQLVNELEDEIRKTESHLSTLRNKLSAITQ